MLDCNKARSLTPQQLAIIKLLDEKSKLLLKEKRKNLLLWIKTKTKVLTNKKREDLEKRNRTSSAAPSSREWAAKKQQKAVKDIGFIDAETSRIDRQNTRNQMPSRIMKHVTRHLSEANSSGQRRRKAQ
ncbi:hypothetical protein RR48_09535 [Papilio machaon]|uniref:Uncharacterized protein n=1 Tax=Papilio machaon TaxID=76193 RepID=A0A194R3I3_PAPMA|nr:hypothetical protein RR48_09535 [Papilio machaon]